MADIKLKNIANTEFSISHNGTRGAKSVTSDQIVVAVGTINDFPANAETGDTVIVKDMNRGGTFIYDATQSAVNNSGTIFNGWCRQYDGAVNVKWFGVTTSNSDFSLAEASGLDLFFDTTYTLESTFTFSSDKTLYFKEGARIILNADITVSSLVDSTSGYPFVEKDGKAYLAKIYIPVGATRDITILQEAIDKVPENYYQSIYIQLDEGDYGDGVVNGKQGSSMVRTGGERATLLITKSDSANIDNVLVNSLLFVSCGGSAFNPICGQITIDGYNTVTNELSSVEFYGCPSGAVINTKFRAVGADRCITSYGSKISVEGLDFGTSLYNYALVTKHGGEIYSPNAEGLNAEGILDHVGTLNIAVTRVITGIVNAATLATVKSNGAYRHDTTGLRSGYIYESLERTMYGPQIFNKAISNYQTFFENLSNFEQFVTVGSSATVTSSQGITLNAIASGTSTIWVRRSNAIRNNNASNLKSSQMAISFTVSSITLDGSITAGNGGSSSEGGYGIEITVANGVRGYYTNSNVRTYTPIITGYANVVGRNLNCYIVANKNGDIEFTINDNNNYIVTSKTLLNPIVKINCSFVIALACIGSTGTASAVFNEARVARF